MYDPLQQNTEVEIQNCLEHQGAAMKLWWDDLPDFLRINPRSLPLYAPPSHIVTLKYDHKFSKLSLADGISVAYTTLSIFCSTDLYSFDDLTRMIAYRNLTGTTLSSV